MPDRENPPQAMSFESVLRRVFRGLSQKPVNAGKLAALDALAPRYLALCQQYMTLFCTIEHPNKLRDPLYETPLSERWHRVAIIQAAGIAKSWRSNRANAFHDYERAQKKYQERLAAYRKGAKDPEEQAINEPKAPLWQEWNISTLRQWCLQTNANVARTPTHMIWGLSREVDDSGMSFPGAAFLAAPQYPLAQGLEARPTICLTFDELQAMHMALNGTLRPNQRESGFDRVVISFERLSEAAQFRDTGFFGLLEPGIQAVSLPLTKHARQFLDQFIRRSNLLICLAQLCQVGVELRLLSPAAK